MIKICNVEPKKDGNKIITQFDVVVDAEADTNARFEWWEWSTRAYDVLAKPLIWKELFASNQRNDMFIDASDALAECGEGSPKISFTVRDEPSITILNEENDNSRRLDFILVMQLTKSEIYVAACRQEIKVNEQIKDIEKAVFQTSGFISMSDDDVSNIRGRMYEDVVLDNIIAEYPDLRMETVGFLMV